MTWASTQSKLGRLALSVVLLLSTGAGGASGQSPPAPPEFPTQRPPHFVARTGTSVPSAQPWTHPLKDGWNLVAFPGQVSGPILMPYQLVDVATGQVLEGSPSPGRAYWAFSEGDGSIQAKVTPVKLPEKLDLDLSPGWNAFASPSNQPIALQGLSAEDVYSKGFQGDVGAFEQVNVQTGLQVEPGQVTWVYAYKPTALSLSAAAPGAEGPANSLTGLTPWSVAGRIVDERGYAVAKARIRCQSSSGQVSGRSDSQGRFRIECDPTPQGSKTFQMTISSRYANSVTRQVTLPLSQPLQIQLTRKSTTLYISAYSYRWGNVEYLPSKVQIWESGNYHRRATRWFQTYGPGRQDVYIKNFPMGMPYRMTVTWVTRRGVEQTLTRDGTITQEAPVFNLYNSWTYN